MMMRLAAFLATFASATAAPALVWQSSEDRASSVHSADEISAESLLSGLESKSVVFLLGRSDNGAESLTQMASQLPTVAAKPASKVHHHVMGVQNAGHLVANTPESVKISLEELEQKTRQVEIESTGKIAKRAQKIDNANVLVVELDANTEPTIVDRVVSNAIGNFDNVVFTAVRSVAEVKQERENAARRRLESMHKAGSRMEKRRRLEDQQDENENDQAAQQQDDNSDLEGVYYVHLTPNILAGILFFFLFATVTWIGVSCMGMISGQDCYVHKMPTIGREA